MQDTWPNYLEYSKKGLARGTPNAAMKLAREVSAVALAPPGGALFNAILLCPSETALQKESNYAMASMTMGYEDWVHGAAGHLHVGSWVPVTDEKGKALGYDKPDQMKTRGAWGMENGAWGVTIAGKSYQEAQWNDYSALFSAGNPTINTWGGSASEWMLNETQLAQTARWWKTNMAKTAAIADVNASYFIRFAYEKIMVYYTLGIGRSPTGPTSGQFTFFAQKFLGFTPGSDWRKYPPFLLKPY